MFADHFDVERAAGVRPRKGFGWMNEVDQREEIARLLLAGDRRPWVVERAKWFGMKLEIVNDGRARTEG